MLPHISSVSMSRWFIAQRGKALAISNTGYALGEAFLPVLFTTDAELIIGKTYGLWRPYSLFNGAFNLDVIKKRKNPQTLAEEVLWHVRKIVDLIGSYNASPFWFMLPALIGPSHASLSFFSSAYFAEIKSWTHLQLVALFPIYTLVAIIFNLVSGWALDKYGLDRILPFIRYPWFLHFIILALFRRNWDWR